MEYWAEFLIAGHWVRSFVKYHSLKQIKECVEVDEECQIVKITNTEKREVLK